MIGASRNKHNDMTYSQHIYSQNWPGESHQGRNQRGLHRSASNDDAWHSVWKRIERAEPVAAAYPDRRQGRSLQPPRDYVVDLDS
jgi:hypothetical protein